jgi:hypothetical protein
MALEKYWRYSKNSEDEPYYKVKSAIRSQAPKSAIIMDMEKVQRLNGYGL